MSRLFRKILAGVIALFAIITATTAAISGWDLYRDLTEEYKSKGIAIAKSIANSGVEMLLNGNLSSLQGTVDQFLDIQGVSYLLVLDSQDEIISHTFVPAIPEEISSMLRNTQKRGVVYEHTEVRDIDIKGIGHFIDVSCPILAGVVGNVHVGMDRQIILNTIKSTLLRQLAVLFLIFLSSIVLSYVLASRLSRPLVSLTRYARELSSRNWSASLGFESDDEIGLLGKTMESMAAELQGVFEGLEKKVFDATQELRDKNGKLQDTLRQIESMQKQIIMQEKMASLGTLTAGIAHEIKNPLNFVNNFAILCADLTQELRELLQSQRDRLSVEELQVIDETLTNLEQNLGKINQHGKRADSIVRGMLLHSRGRAGEIVATDVNTLLMEDLNLAFQSMRAKDSSFNVVIETNFDKSIGSINVVPQDISRVFLNLISNACYSAYQKKREVGNAFTPVLSVNTKGHGDRVEVRIRDNGKGIPQNILDRIFNPFFTTKPPGEGTGLGLSISYDIIVQGHKGEVKVESEEGSYAEFIILLPRSLAVS
jgi:signal transduction histidine kinase